MIGLIIASAVLLLLIIFIIVASVLLANITAKPKVITFPEEIEYEKKHGMWKDYDALEKNEYIIKSFDGYELHTTFVPSVIPSDKYVIISHGFCGCRLGSVKYLHVFHDLGFNAVMYDDRRHGENAKTVCTMGFKESRDLMQVIADTYDRYGESIHIGLHGESMGSGLTVNALQYKPSVDFIISDCGYNDLNKLLTDLVRRKLHLPAFFAWTANIANSLLYGYRFTDVSPIKYLRENEIPICFIHGQEDDLIPHSHALEMHEVNKGYSEVHIVPGAPHAYSIIQDEAGYRKIVADFLSKI